MQPRKSQFNTSLEYVNALWEYFNKKLFGSKLVKPMIYFTKNKSYYGGWSSKMRTLQLDEKFLNNENTLRDVLLHEMAHQAAHEIDHETSKENGGHTQIWAKWMHVCGLNPDKYITTAQKTSILSKAEQIRYDRMKSEESKSKLLIPIKVGDYAKYPSYKQGKWLLGKIVAYSQSQKLVIMQCADGKRFKLSSEKIYRVSKQEADKISFDLDE